ncbi:ParB/RepB/Spo0J family partition protein [Sedimentitalea nanhaiensis]|uniref:Chromosome partitioning protein, ParB family n=1 Tax=Sedimentitalea nanhaiensis TaxID=999627 RepID=A0A1I7BG73_9RHOB|nr:ParB N-terminal domain-containing protein [Sedimentitalea nanhaiensis]SFT86142.1 chromosome partitioning protein, ParB family [Sedimentitalea nanhaiensis]
MAKRRKLEAPSTEDLSRIEDEFRRETSVVGASPAAMTAGRAVAPIAQIAADSAAHAQTADPARRAEQARNAADADRLRHAQAQGLLIAELPLEQIDGDAMIRDRTVLDEDQMVELRQSIAASGLRLPIEVVALDPPRDDGARYALVSGYRRLMAVRGLRDLTENPKYDTIRAIIRPGKGADAAFVSMVEENEVRSELSQFERGRIAVISAQQGAFVNVEDAVNRLFATASKAKRSKVRSFALIFEELGDMLAFPESLSEKRGLQLAQALRGGGESTLREALASADPQSPEAEWAAIEQAIAAAEPAARDARRGGRPKSAPRAGQGASGWQNAETLRTSGGITIRKMRDDKGFLLRFEGAGMDQDLMDSLMAEIRDLLERP